MPPRRWSDRDTNALKQLFEHLMFQVEIYTDSTHNLNASVSRTDFSLCSILQYLIIWPCLLNLEFKTAYE